jgi:glycosyltransferase involved in cell wall biosynthesis
MAGPNGGANKNCVGSTASLTANIYGIRDERLSILFVAFIVRPVWPAGFGRLKPGRTKLIASAFNDCPMRVAILANDNRNEQRRYSDRDPDFGSAPSALLQGLAKLSNCEVHVLSCTQRPLHSPVRLFDNIYYHSLVVGKWGWLRGAYVGCVSAIRRKLREIKPDLVHGQGTERFCALAAVYSGFPNVVTIHGNMRMVAQVNQARPFSFLWLAARLEEWALPRTRGVLCNSIHTHQQVSLLARTTWMVPNALREIFFSPPKSAPDASPVVFNIGVISPLKSQNELLELAAKLHQRNPHFQMQFIGKLDEQTAYGTEFRSRINRAQQIGYASYLGQKSVSDLVELMDRAAGLIHFPKEESFGLVVAEGLARNLKLFGANVGGIKDLAAGVEGAELFEPGDATGLEVSMLKWLATGSPKIKQGAEEMRQRYHPEVIARRHLEIYRQVLKANQSGPADSDSPGGAVN